MDNKSFFTWGAGYAAKNSTNNSWSSSTTASSAPLPGTTTNQPSTTSSAPSTLSSRPEDTNNSRRIRTNFGVGNTAFGGGNSAFGGTNYAFGGSNPAFGGGGGTTFGSTGFNSTGDVFSSKGASFGGSSSESNNVVGSVGGGEADQFTKLCSNIETMQISSSATTSSHPATSSSATSSSSVQASVSAPLPSSTPAPTGDGGGRSSFSSLGETQRSQSPDMSNLNAGYDIQVIQQDESSPYHSIKRFEDLNLQDDVIKGLYNKKFDRPSRIQEHALPLLLRNPPEHLVGQAQSGTGKTAAFCLAILARLNYDDPDCQAIILSPTRELTLQTVDVMKELSRYTKATVATVVYQTHRQYSRVAGQIVIGTPGTVDRMIKMRYLNVAKVMMLVLDEADNMLDMQNLGQMSHQIKRQIPNTAQLVLFSATYPTRLERYIKQFLGTAPKNQVRLHKIDELAIRVVRQFYIDCEDEEDRFSLLSDLYKVMTISKSIIFVQARAVADKITARLASAGHQVTLLHGGLNPEERDKCMDDFRLTRTKVLVATNVLARGIDICDVNMVVNYDLPTTVHGGPNRKKVADPEVYLHRIGRTGRFGRRGVAINFVHSLETYEVLCDIQNHYMCDILKIVTDWQNLEGMTEQEKKETRLDNIETFIKETLKGT